MPRVALVAAPAIIDRLRIVAVADVCPPGDRACVNFHHVPLVAAALLAGRVRSGQTFARRRQCGRAVRKLQDARPTLPFDLAVPFWPRRANVWRGIANPTQALQLLRGTREISSALEHTP